MHNQEIVTIRRPEPAAWLAAVLLMLFTVTSQADTDWSHGLLWEVSKAGKESSYLFGTIHSEDAGIINLPQAVRQAFDSSAIVVLEMLMDAEAMKYSSTVMLMLNGRYLSDVIGTPLFEKVAAAIASRGITEAVLNRMKPWAAAITLSTPAPETGLVLDMLLYQEALQQNKAVYGLETMQEQLDLFDAMPEADQIILLQEAVDNFPQLDALHAEMLAVYKQRDLAGLMAINESSMQTGDQALARDFQRRVVAERNHRMADRMLQYLQQGNAFIAVGALHLPGSEGLLKLLEKHGYTIRRSY